MANFSEMQNQLPVTCIYTFDLFQIFLCLCLPVRYRHNINIFALYLTYFFEQI